MAIQTPTEETDADDGMIGRAQERREDPALLTGDALYTDDIQRARMAHVAFVRSQYGHARIEGIDATPARETDGVLEVYTAADLEASDADNAFGSSPASYTLGPEHPLLASERVRYQGQPIAVVVAEDRYTANTAADRIDVDYERLDAVADPLEAIEADAPAVHEDAPDNIAYEWDIAEETDADAEGAEGFDMDFGAEEADLDAILDAAEHVVELEVENNRLIPTAMETRAAVAEYRPSTNQLTVHATTQNPHLHQQWIGDSLNHPHHKLRVQAHEVGGGFGSKIHQYPGETLTAWCAKQLDRPVKWQATRTEGFSTTYHGRDHRTTVEAGLDGEGRLLGLRVRTYANLGAFDPGAGVPTGYAQMLAGQYDLPALDAVVYGVFTNTVPTHAYRGAGRPEATYVVERLAQACAKQLDMDPAEFRRRNLVPEDAFPYDAATGRTYDSGDYEKTLDRALEAIDYEAFRERQREAREEGRYLGVGLSCYVEACGAGPGLFESGAVQFKPSGEVLVKVGTYDHGQGHHTSFAQIVADELGVPYEDIEVIDGDTDKVQEGNGTYGSRSAPVGGSAVMESARKIKSKAREFAAYRLEADEADIEFDDGEFHVAGVPERSIPIQTIADELYAANDRPEDMEPSLEASTYYDPSNYTFPFGTHAAIVEVDPDSGEIEFERYVAVDDVGNQINPTIVEGQIHGGVVQGLGQALYEGAEYDSNGTLVTGSLQDYAIPKAEHVPELETDSTVTPSPHNPLGAKGVGEAGTIAAPPAVVNAVVDAVEPLGVAPGDIDMPLDPESVWRAIGDAS